ncbi:MAG: class B sortase [Clostridium sp.]
MEMRNINRKKKFSKLQLTFLVIFIVILVFSLGMLCYDEMKVKKEDNQFKDLQAQITNTQDLDILKLKEQNQDLVAWIKINGTNIDYPVMENNEESEYYLYRDFNKEKSISGTPFIGEGVSLNPRSTNIIIYGHNMKNKTMFNNLLLYREKEFWNENSIIELNTESGKEEYKIFSVFETSIDEEKGNNPYYMFKDTKSQEEFDIFINKFKKASIYETNITPLFGDKLITLSTCSYTKKDGRLVVVGTKIK